MDAELSSLCGSFGEQQSFDSLQSLGLASLENDDTSIASNSITASAPPTTTHFSVDEVEQQLRLEIPESLRFEASRELDYHSYAKTSAEFRPIAVPPKCVDFGTNQTTASSQAKYVKQRKLGETVASVSNVRKLVRSRLERLERSPNESQMKLGNIYALLNNAKYKSSAYHYPSTDNSVESYFSDESCEIDLDRVNFNNEKFEFDNVCADLSQNINSFLAETYIKSLLGVFPYNNLSKRRSRSASTKSKHQLKIKSSNKRRKLSSSSTLTSTSLV